MDTRTDCRKVEERSEKANKGGCSNLREWAHNDLLPTPQAQEYDKITGTENQDSLTKRARKMTGKKNTLNVFYSNEMMGFPNDWILKPFLSSSGESVEVNYFEKIRKQFSPNRDYWENFPTVYPTSDIQNIKGLTMDYKKWRKQSIKAIGNTIVPHVALEFLRSIKEYEKLNQDE